jgi:hypothetical protein
MYGRRYLGVIVLTCVVVFCLVIPHFPTPRLACESFTIPSAHRNFLAIPLLFHMYLGSRVTEFIPELLG